MESRRWLIPFVIFLAYNYKVSAQCSGPLDIPLSTPYQIGTLTYPSSGTYTENRNCTWNLISSTPATEDILMFIQISHTRSNDILTIFDAPSTSIFVSDTAGTSGQSVSVVAPSGTGKINFVSDGVADTNQDGFTVTYMPASSNDGGGCSSPVNLTATDTKQYLTSQNFPSKYPSNSNCDWTITAQDSCGSLVLDFILIDLEADCSVDKVTVTYDGGTPIDLCPSTDWNSGSDYTTTGTSASITMISDGSDEEQGFVMSYIRTGCTVTTTTGQSDSPPAETGSNVGGIVGGVVGSAAGVSVAVTAGVLYAKGIIGPKGVQAGGKSNLGTAKKGVPDMENTGDNTGHTSEQDGGGENVENGAVPMATY